VIRLSDDNLRGLRSVLFFVSDSLRWDSFERAQTPTIARFAPHQEQRVSYASWTQPSHACLLSGLFPHANVAGSRAADVYANDFGFWAQALTEKAELGSELYPHMCLPRFAQDHGWRPIASVAMPVLNECTSFSRGFDQYLLSPQGGNMGTQISEIVPSLSGDRDLLFMNVGETHYPYLLPRETMPRISGVRGAAASLASSPNRGRHEEFEFTAELLADMHASQIAGLEMVDKHLRDLIDCLAKPLLFIFVSDHGELFGEDGFVGHGPFFHRLLFEVPLALGVVR
jgi:hypothetical protein